MRVQGAGGMVWGILPRVGAPSLQDAGIPGWERFLGGCPLHHPGILQGIPIVVPAAGDDPESVSPVEADGAGCWNGAPPGRCGATAAAGPPPGTRPGDAGPLPQVLGWNYQIAQLAVIDHQGQHGHSRQGPRFSGHRPPRRFQLRHQGAVETGLPEHPQIALFPPFAQVVPAVLDGHYPSDVGLYHPANFKLQGHSPLTRLAESKQRSGVLRIVTEIQTKNLLLSRQIRAIAAA